MQNYRWRVRCAMADDWEIELLEPQITPPLVEEAVADARAHGATFILLDICSLPDDPNKNGGFSVFPDEPAVCAVVERLQAENGVFVQFDF